MADTPATALVRLFFSPEWSTSCGAPCLWLYTHDRLRGVYNVNGLLRPNNQRIFGPRRCVPTNHSPARRWSFWCQMIWLEFRCGTSGEVTARQPTDCPTRHKSTVRAFRCSAWCPDKEKNSETPRASSDYLTSNPGKDTPSVFCGFLCTSSTSKRTSRLC